MRMVAGDRLGPYQIVASLGAGGMGEVYRAHDTRLNRDGKSLFNSPGAVGAVCTIADKTARALLPTNGRRPVAHS